MTNKKGNILAILLIVGGLFLLMFMGLLLIIGSSVLNFVADTVVPELSGIGMVGGSNVTQAVDITVTPVDTLIQNFTWVAGLVYVFGIIGIFGIAFGFRSSGEKWLIGLFIAMVLILVISSIFISNIYEEFQTGTDDVASRLNEHKLLSYMLLYSPMIISLVSFIAGIILFGGNQEGLG